MILCHNCRTDNPSGAKRCDQCGEPLLLDREDVNQGERDELPDHVSLETEEEQRRGPQIWRFGFLILVGNFILALLLIDSGAIDDFPFAIKALLITYIYYSMPLIYAWFIIGIIYGVLTRK